jgi:asparagine synthase (glutamine-hydrolysing)
MCGITGFINFSGHDQDKSRKLLKRMTDTLVHRGPDAEGFYVDDFAALGHRRLSIIDIAGGHQPMATPDSNFQIVFNGEIYNFIEIRKDLTQKGYQFQTNSDTEVILHAFVEWGQACVERFNGMFAFAIWNKKHKELFLARDRAGKKPLYCYWDGKRFSFASELKALSHTGICPKKIDYQALDCYFSFGYIPSPLTIYQDVLKLPSAHSMFVKSTGMSKKRYWHLHFIPDTRYNSENALEEFEALLDEATNCRLMSEVPLGAFLSGGFDSTLVVSSMVKMLNTPVLTNSIGFDEKEFNELPVAKAVADHLHTNHKEFIVSPDAMAVLNKIAWHFDEPFADSSAVPTWYVCQMAKQNVTVALSGDGGDESFGGYTFRYLPHILESAIRSAVPTVLRKLFFGSIGSIYPQHSKLPQFLRLKTILENISASHSEAFYRDLIWLHPNSRENLYSPEFHKNLLGFTPYEFIEPLYNSENAHSPLNRSQHTDINFYMTDDVLTKVDRISMAHSLEVRAPLLDYRILEFAAKLPQPLKIKEKNGKILLKHLAAQRLPPQVTTMPKKGFSIPAAKWLREDLKGKIESVLNKNDNLLSAYLQKNQLLKIWRQHQSGTRDHSVLLWAVMMFDLWEEHHHNKI